MYLLIIGSISIEVGKTVDRPSEVQSKQVSEHIHSYQSIQPGLSKINYGNRWSGKDQKNVQRYKIPKNQNNKHTIKVIGFIIMIYL